jgi:pimeloyl-ACP methyl ester carboxylesterase
MIIPNQDNTQTYLHEAGHPANPAILLLHGQGGDHEMWAPQIEYFTSQGYYVLAPDMLAHGKSSKLDQLTLVDWENQINDLLTHKGVSSCILVGLSMGGVIAQYYTVHNPEKVSKLVLSDTFGELNTLQEKVLAISQVLGFRIYKLLGREMLSKGMAATYKAPFAHLAQEYMQKAMLNIDFDQLILTRKAINQIDVIGMIDGEQVPTLVLVGDEFGKSFVEINKKIAEGIAGSKFVVIRQAMDPSNLTNPDAFNREVIAFIT